MPGHGYPELVTSLARRNTGTPRLLEIGGGRNPLLSREAVAELNCSYTVNDIDQAELDRAPEWVRTLQGDIADPALPASAGHGEYDLMFSRLVFEHVHDPSTAYRNIFKMLAPGGVFVNLIPTLYAPPFIANLALPEKSSSAVLAWAMPNRNDAEVPKFPAFYRWCTSTRRTQRKLDAVGFRHCLVVPFYGHDYYRKLPGLRQASAHISSLAARKDWRGLSTYALILCER